MDARTALPLSERALVPFLAGAGADALIGFDLLLAAGWLADFLVPGTPDVAGVPVDDLLRGIGAALVAWSAATFAFVWLDTGRLALWAVFAANKAWVVLSVAAVVFGQEALSGAGNVLIVSVACGVGALAFAQYRVLCRPARA